MKKIFLFLFIAIFALCSSPSYSQIKVAINVYSHSVTNTSNIEKISFAIENYYNVPVYVFSISINDVNRNSTFYYSNDPLIINSNGGIATAWGSTLYIEVNKNCTNGSDIFNSIYSFTISYAQIYDGAKSQTDIFYTNHSVGGYLVSNTASINNIKYKNEDNKYYDLNGFLIKSPEKGKIYIYNGKKIIY